MSSVNHVSLQIAEGPVRAGGAGLAVEGAEKGGAEAEATNGKETQRQRCDLSSEQPDAMRQLQLVCFQI